MSETIPVVFFFRLLLHQWRVREVHLVSLWLADSDKMKNDGGFFFFFLPHSPVLRYK